MTALAITHVEVLEDTLIGSETFSGETYLQCIIRFPTRNESTSYIQNTVAFAGSRLDEETLRLVMVLAYLLHLFYLIFLF